MSYLNNEYLRSCESDDIQEYYIYEDQSNKKYVKIYDSFSRNAKYEIQEETIDDQEFQAEITGKVNIFDENVLPVSLREQMNKGLPPKRFSFSAHNYIDVTNCSTFKSELGL